MLPDLSYRSACVDTQDSSSKLIQADKTWLTYNNKFLFLSWTGATFEIIYLLSY